VPGGQKLKNLFVFKHLLEGRPVWAAHGACRTVGQVHFFWTPARPAAQGALENLNEINAFCR
jgi:hypothetical protein